MRRQRRDFLQNIAIVLLSLSAVALFAQTQLYNLNVDMTFLTQLAAGSGPAAGTNAPTSLTDVSAPVRTAVAGPYGRYGDLQLTTTDEAFFPLGTLLREALGSAQTFTPCAPADFLSALEQTSVYYDFLGALPLSIVGGLVGAPLESDAAAARQLVVADGGDDGALLYLWDGQQTYLRCPVAISSASLAETVDRYELGNAFFAFESTEADPAFAQVSPRSLFLSPLPELPSLTATASLSDTDWLLAALGFNPNTKFRYTEADGTEVIVEGDASLRIRSDGSIRYQSGDTPLLEIDAAGDRPTATEAAIGGGSLLGSLLDHLSGEASLFLRACRTNGTATQLQFGLQVSGVPIRFSNGDSAAEITLDGTYVTGLTLRLRQYSASGETAALLPLRQTLAIAARQPGSELSLGYADKGDGPVSASWLLD